MSLTHRSALIAAGLLLVATGVAAGVATAASRGAKHARVAQTQTVVHVPADTVDWFVDSNVALTRGETFSVSATGTAQFNSAYPAVGPAGLRFVNAICAKNQYADPSSWASTGINCYSLVGKIGGGPAFLVGPTFQLRSPASGELYLGFNDDYPYDNSGEFVATVTTP